MTAAVEYPWRSQPYALTGPVLTVWVFGEPVPQGSIRSLGKGRPSIHGNAARLLPWREAVQGAVMDAIRNAERWEWPILGPVAVSATFTMRKPKAAPKRRRTFPISRPDCDHLERAVGDALQNAGAVRDDSQIVDWHGSKVFPREHMNALDVPGVHITVWTVQ